MHPAALGVSAGNIAPVAMGDLSVNSSFQTDIHTLVNAVNQQYSQQLESYLEQKKDELQRITANLIEERQRQKARDEAVLKDHLAKAREHMSEQAQAKLESQMQHILLQKEKAIIQAKENQTMDVKDFEKTRLLKKYEMKMI